MSHYPRSLLTFSETIYVSTSAAENCVTNLIENIFSDTIRIRTRDVRESARKLIMGRWVASKNQFSLSLAWVHSVY